MDPDGDDVPVGAVVLDASGTERGAAANRREADGDPTAHAELLALRQAAASSGSWRLDDCTLVVSLEPCPMCAGAAVQSRVARVVWGATNSRAGAAGTVLDVLGDPRWAHRPEVVGGVLADEAGAVLDRWFARRRRGPRDADVL